MEQIGIVNSINNNSMQVTVIRSSACGGNCSSCGSGCESKLHTVTIDKMDGIKVGDTVKITSDSYIIYKYMAIVYLIPLVVFVFVFVLCQLLFLISEVLSLAISAISLFIVSFFVKKYDSYKDLKTVISIEKIDN